MYRMLLLLMLSLLLLLLSLLCLRHLQLLRDQLCLLLLLLLFPGLLLLLCSMFRLFSHHVLMHLLQDLRVLGKLLLLLEHVLLRLEIGLRVRKGGDHGLRMLVRLMMR